METKFKDVPVPGYFQMKGKIYQKITKRKARLFGRDAVRTICSNPAVFYYGQDINDVIRQSKAS